MSLTWAGGEKLWSSAEVIATLVLGFAICLAFVAWEYKGAALPLIRSMYTQESFHAEKKLTRKVNIFKARVVNGAALTQLSCPNPLTLTLTLTCPSINGWNFVTQIYYIPTFYQLVHGYSPTKSGALLLPVTLTQSASNPLNMKASANQYAKALFSTLSGLIVHKTGRYRVKVMVLISTKS